VIAVAHQARLRYADLIDTPTTPLRSWFRADWYALTLDPSLDQARNAEIRQVPMAAYSLSRKALTVGLQRVRRRTSQGISPRA